MCALKSVFSCMCVNSLSGVIYSPQSEALSGAGHMDASFSPPPPPPRLLTLLLCLSSPPFQSHSSYFSIANDAFFNCGPPHRLPLHLHVHSSWRPDQLSSNSPGSTSISFSSLSSPLLFSGFYRTNTYMLPKCEQK